MDDINMGRRGIEGCKEEKRICHSVGHPYVDFDIYPLLLEGICEPSQF